MGARRKHTEGFTLAELLLSIAIVLVLAALAIPSIIAAQNNMRIVELDSAAEAIANAAQVQMTAKKAGGTWLALIEDEASGDVKFPQAKNPPSTAPTDTFYMTADEARSNGIVASLSVDDDVRDGDYVIEFTASTAQVVSVFFTDGKAGFFDADRQTDAVSGNGGFYANNSTMRGDETGLRFRMDYTPMIGYYEGTPTGATDAVALKNPVIRVDKDSGRLCIQDPNIPSRSTSTTVTLKKTDDAGVHEFVISGLDESLSMISVSKANADDPDTKSISAPNVKEVVELLDQNGLAGGNVYFIDLNALVRVFSESYAGSEIVNILGLFNEDDEVEVSATTVLKDNPYNSIPATARAVVRWPAPVGTLSVLVGTPWSTTLAKKDIAGTNNPAYLRANDYTQPEVNATTTSGKPSQTISSRAVEELLPLKASDVNSKLVAINKQSGWQSYLGGEVGYAKAAGDPTFVLKASVGSYKTHRYQIGELWARQANGNAVRVGYVRNGTWEWANANGVNYAPLDNALTWYDDAGVVYDDLAGSSADILERIVSVDVNASAWGDVPGNLGLRDSDGSMTLYLRTMPRSSEVQAYFDGKAEQGTLLSDMRNNDTNELYTELSARGVNKTVHTNASVNFEAEFGAPSSSAAWAIARDAATGFDSGNRFAVDRGAVRVYYAISPAVGFENIQGAENPLNLRSTVVTNASLFMYLTNKEALEKQPVARENRDQPGDYTFRSYQGATDFSLKTEEDYRFYRAIEYYDDDGATKFGIASQYAPYTAMNGEIAQGADKTVGDTEWRFTGWTTTDTKSGQSITVEPGDMVADYDALFSYKGVKLIAHYVEVPKVEETVGLMYLEFDSAGNVTGMFGSLDSEAIQVSSLPDGNEIATWGYYAVVPHGIDKPAVRNSEGNSALNGATKTVSIDGTLYDAYEISFGNASNLLNKNQVVTCSLNDQSYTYYINAHFAAAVALDKSTAKDWGEDEDTPYLIRHADQFVYAAWPQEYLMDPYLKKKSYLQTHDLQLDATPLRTASGVFDDCTYDGGGFALWDVNYSTLTRYYWKSIGLFPEARKSEFKNVTLKFSSSSQTLSPGFSSSENGFGFLVGEANDCEFKTCRVEGSGSRNATHMVELADTITWSGHLSSGGLVGIAQKIEFSDCVVSNVTIKTVSGPSRQLDFGGLAGTATGKIEIEDEGPIGTSANSVLFIAYSQASTMGFGGLIGLVSGSLEIESPVTFNVEKQVLDGPVESVSDVVGRQA